MSDILTSFFNNYEKEKDNPLFTHDIFLVDNNILSFSPKRLTTYKSLSTDKSYHSSINYNNLSKKLGIDQSSISILGKSNNNKNALSNISVTKRSYDYYTYLNSDKRKYSIEKNDLRTEMYNKKLNLLNFGKKTKNINCNSMAIFKNKLLKKLYKDDSKKLLESIFEDKQNKIDKIAQNLIENKKYKKFKITEDENSIKNQKSKELTEKIYSKDYIKVKFLNEIKNQKAFKSLERQKRILVNEKFRNSLLKGINDFNFNKNKHKKLKKPAGIEKKTPLTHKAILENYPGEESIKNIKTECNKMRNCYFPEIGKKEDCLTFDEKMYLFIKKAKASVNYFTDRSNSYHRMQNEMDQLISKKNGNKKKYFKKI